MKHTLISLCAAAACAVMGSRQSFRPAGTAMLREGWGLGAEGSGYAGRK